MYEIYISNIGKVSNCKNIDDAKKEFLECVQLSESNFGRASGESVTLFDNDGEIIAEHIGDN